MAAAGKNACGLLPGVNRRVGPLASKKWAVRRCRFMMHYGVRLGTRRLARMPESHKARSESKPDGRGVQRPGRAPRPTGGEAGRWCSGQLELSRCHPPRGRGLGGLLPCHGAPAWGAGRRPTARRATTCQAQFEKLRRLLRDDPEGIDKVIRALRYLHDKHPRRKTIRTALEYFRRHRHRMGYAQAQAEGLPIGSGVVEAACKTVVTQRMKRSGMRWRHEGGQAILTFRSLCQSDRFDRAWALPGADLSREVKLPAEGNRLEPSQVRSVLSI